MEVDACYLFIWVDQVGGLRGQCWLSLNNPFQVSLSDTVRCYLKYWGIVQGKIYSILRYNRISFVKIMDGINGQHIK